MKHIYLSKEILKDKRLTPATKLVAHHLFHISGWEKETIIPSQKQIAKTLDIESKTVRTALKTLSDLDYLFINANNTFTFKINGYEFNKKDLSNKMLCNIVGDFVIVPTVSLYGDNERGFRKHIQNIKEKGLIDYSVVQTGFGKSKLVGVKAYTFESVVEDK